MVNLLRASCRRGIATVILAWALDRRKRELGRQDFCVSQSITSIRQQTAAEVWRRLHGNRLLLLVNSR